MLKEILLRSLLGEVSLSFGNKTNKIASEIHDCMAYFEDPKLNGINGEKLKLVQGIGITVGRLEGKEKGYFWKIDGVVKTTGKDVVSPHEYEEIVQKIHHITFPYADYVKSKQHKA